MTELEQSLSFALAELSTQYNADMQQLLQQNQQLSNRVFSLAEQIDSLSAKLNALNKTLIELAEG